mmetsp:Transcript_32202/g.94108  ORF Transcript_32202/g.94108 Transcript_32202/m.94108 type:complete len:405 (+) Transcript_32202:105-1319(+)
MHGHDALGRRVHLGLALGAIVRLVGDQPLAGVAADRRVPGEASPRAAPGRRQALREHVADNATQPEIRVLQCALAGAGERCRAFALGVHLAHAGDPPERSNCVLQRRHCDPPVVAMVALQRGKRLALRGSQPPCQQLRLGAALEAPGSETSAAASPISPAGRRRRRRTRQGRHVARRYHRLGETPDSAAGHRSAQWSVARRGVGGGVVAATREVAHSKALGALRGALPCPPGAGLDPPVFADEANDGVQHYPLRAIAQHLRVEEHPIHMLLLMLQAIWSSLQVRGGDIEARGCAIDENVVRTPLHEDVFQVAEQPGPPPIATCGARSVNSPQFGERRPIASGGADDVGDGMKGPAVQDRQQLRTEADAHNWCVRKVQHGRSGLRHMRGDVHGLREHDWAAAAHD